MTWVDFAVLGFIALSGLLAFGRGLVREVLGVGAWAGAGLIGVTQLPLMRPYVEGWLHAPEWINPVSFVLLFLGSLLVLSILARIVGRFVRNSVLGGVDRTLGLLFGLARGASVVIIAYIIGQMVFPIDRWPDAVLNARVLAPTYAAAAWVRDQLPEEYRPSRLDPPPSGRQATAEDLFHATPLGRATAKPLVQE